MSPLLGARHPPFRELCPPYPGEHHHLPLPPCCLLTSSYSTTGGGNASVCRSSRCRNLGHTHVLPQTTLQVPAHHVAWLHARRVSLLSLPSCRPATMPPISVQGTAISGSRRSKVQDRPTSSPPASRRHTLSATPSARRHTLSATPSSRRHTLSATPTPPRGFLQRNHTVMIEDLGAFPCLPQVSFSDPPQ